MTGATGTANLTFQSEGDLGRMDEPADNAISIIIQSCLLVSLLALGLATNGSLFVLFVRFKSLRIVSNFLLLDLIVVQMTTILVNVPLFMELYLFNKRRYFSMQKRWFAMLFHRFFLFNDLTTQLALIIDYFLVIRFGKRFTCKKTTFKVKAFIIFKWLVILAILLVFSIPTYNTYGSNIHVFNESYQRLLFGPNQIIWKVVIPSCHGILIITVLSTNRFIKKSRRDLWKRYNLKVFGKGSRNSSKAVTTLLLIMVVQTLCKVPACVYSYISVNDDSKNNHWFAFLAYFFLFLSGTTMPIIYYTRSSSLRRVLFLCKDYPFTSTRNFSAAEQVSKYGLRFSHHRPSSVRRKQEDVLGNQSCNLPNKIFPIPAVLFNLQEEASMARNLDSSEVGSTKKEEVESHKVEHTANAETPKDDPQNEDTYTFDTKL